MDLGLSASRVGVAAQIKVTNQVGILKFEIAQYREVAAFAQFVYDFEASTLYKLLRRGILTGLLKLKQFVPMLSSEIYNFAIIEPGIHYFTVVWRMMRIRFFLPQSDLGNGRRSAVLPVASSRQSSNADFLPQHDLGNGLRSAALLRYLITPVIHCGLFWILMRIQGCWVRIFT